MAESFEDQIFRATRGMSPEEAKAYIHQFWSGAADGIDGTPQPQDRPASKASPALEAPFGRPAQATGGDSSPVVERPQQQPEADHGEISDGPHSFVSGPIGALRRGLQYTFDPSPNQKAEFDQRNKERLYPYNPSDPSTYANQVLSQAVGMTSSLVPSFLRTNNMDSYASDFGKSDTGILFNRALDMAPGLSGVGGRANPRVAQDQLSPIRTESNKMKAEAFMERPKLPPADPNSPTEVMRRGNREANDIKAQRADEDRAAADRNSLLEAHLRANGRVGDTIGRAMPQLKIDPPTQAAEAAAKYHGQGGSMPPLGEVTGSGPAIDTSTATGYPRSMPELRDNPRNISPATQDIAAPKGGSGPTGAQTPDDQIQSSPKPPRTILEALDEHVARYRPDDTPAAAVPPVTPPKPRPARIKQDTRDSIQDGLLDLEGTRSDVSHIRGLRDMLASKQPEMRDASSKAIEDIAKGVKMDPNASNTAAAVKRAVDRTSGYLDANNGDAGATKSMISNLRGAGFKTAAVAPFAAAALPSSDDLASKMKDAHGSADWASDAVKRGISTRIYAQAMGKKSGDLTPEERSDAYRIHGMTLDD